MGKVIGLNHMGIVVEDLEKMKAFFTGVLGFSVEREYGCKDDDFCKGIGLGDARIKIAELCYADQSPAMKLLSYESCKSSNTQRPKDFMINDTGLHYRLEVRGIDEIYEKLPDAGLECLSPPFWRESGNSYFFCRDPEGNFCGMVQCGK